MPEQRVELKAADGSALAGLWRQPEGPGPWPSVACVHGLTLTKALFDEPAAALEAQGVASLRVDLRGHGDSGGRLQDQGFDDQLEDVCVAITALGALPGADPLRRGLLGFSLGGALGSLVAGGGGIQALALWSPLLKTGFWDEDRRKQYGPAQGEFQPIWDGVLVSRRLFTEAITQDPYAAAVAFEGPCFVCHGGKDRNHPQARSVELAAARQAQARPVASYFPPLSGHRYHAAPERRQRDALTAAFFGSCL